MKIDAKSLNEKMEELNKELLEIMIQNNKEPVDMDEGTMTVTSRRAWTYPEEIVIKQKEVKKEEKIAQQLGTATYIENFSTKFTPAGSSEFEE
jgi:hypothetical protein